MDALFKVGATALLLGLVFLCLVPATARADDGSAAGSTDPPALRRELAGHNFIPSRFSLDPFVSTYVGSETGFGYGTAAGHTYDIAGNPVSTATYQVGAFAQLLNFQYGFVDWWAVRLSTQLTVFSGVNGSGAAAVGVNAVTHVGLGTTVSFKVGDNLRLGGSFDFTFGPSIFFNIVQTVVDSIDNGTIVSPVTSQGNYSLQPAFVGAWTIAKWVGLTFSASYGFSNATSSNSAGTSTSNVSLLSGGGLFDFDLASVGAPIGFLLGYGATFSANAAQFRQFQWQTGIFYTGVKPLNLGLEIVYRRAPLIGNLDTFVSSLLGLITLQYNFN